MSTAPSRRAHTPGPRAADAPAPAVREASAHDHDAVRHVLRSAFAQYLPVLGPVLHAHYVEDLCDLDGRLDGAVLLVATLDDDIVGTVTFHPAPVGGHFAWPPGWSVVRAFGVEPACRGRGVADALLQDCLDRAAAGGATTVGLHTADFMAAAVRLYERWGFERVPSLDIDAGSLVDTDGAQAPLAIAYRRAVDQEAVDQ